MTGDGATGGVGWPRAVGVVGGAAGLAASVFVLFGPVVSVESSSWDGTVTTGSLSGIDWLLGVPDAQFALFAWPVLLGAVSVVGLVAAWRRQGRWLWTAALTLLAFVFVGVFTIGMLYGPAALLLLVAAALGRRS